MPEPTPGVGPTAEPGSQGTDGRGEAGRNPVAPGASEPTPNPPSDLATLEASVTQLKADAAASARQEQANRVALQQQQQANATLQAQIAAQVPEPLLISLGLVPMPKTSKRLCLMVTRKA